MADRRNFLRNALDAMVEARAREVAKYVNTALLMLDDDTLKSRGIDRRQIAKGQHPFR